VAAVVAHQSHSVTVEVSVTPRRSHAPVPVVANVAQWPVEWLEQWLVLAMELELAMQLAMELELELELERICVANHREQSIARPLSRCASSSRSGTRHPMCGPIRQSKEDPPIDPNRCRRYRGSVLEVGRVEVKVVAIVAQALGCEQTQRRRLVLAVLLVGCWIEKRFAVAQSEYFVP
jgi:hypothetical protein